MELLFRSLYYYGIFTMTAATSTKTTTITSRKTDYACPDEEVYMAVVITIAPAVVATTMP